MGRMKCLWLLLGVVLFTVSIYDVSADVTPSENECRPYIEKAIHELKNTETTATENDNKDSTEDDSREQVDAKSQEDGTGSNQEKTDDVSGDSKQESVEEVVEKSAENDGDSQEQTEGAAVDTQDSKEQGNESKEDAGGEQQGNDDGDSKEETGEEDGGDSKEVTDGDSSKQEDDSKEETAEADETQTEEQNSAQDANESEQTAEDNSTEPEQQKNESVEEENTAAEDNNDSNEDQKSDEKEEEKSAENVEQEADDGKDSKEANGTEEKEGEESVEEVTRAKRSIPDEASPEQDANESQENAEDDKDSLETANKSEETANDSQEAPADDNESQEASKETPEASQEADNDSQEGSEEATKSTETEDDGKDSQEADKDADDSTEDEKVEEGDTNDDDDDDEDDDDDDDDESNEEIDEDGLTIEFEIPKNLRSRDHISDLLGLDAESSIKENALKRTGDVILKELKKTYDSAIKPLEAMYKYRELSNRHFGDPEIFSKPLVLFMGPWSGGKSTILNYLTENEYTPNSIRSGAEPSPAYFNILMHGDKPEVMDGTQLAADWTFSGLQKFGEGLLDRLRGQRLPNKLLERVNIVEIPGILEVRKQVSRIFPFNDACQWFIDRADIIFLVYDPSKLDVGPETEAILDQLKGREYQTRILLNKADQVKPEELLRVQGALIWNISPLMSSAQPPVMYTVSLWSHPFEAGSPIRLLQAQERALLSDLREAIDKRIENKIASARRFAVRIRNHAKMVDCYLTTYYNQKSLFSNKKQISDKIIEHPQDYNIYEGLSTLTNISRYDLPDPEVYLDFFRLNPLYEFKKLAETCTYFKGCPINKLDIAIAYDLPELVGKYKILLEENFSLMRKEYDENCNQSVPEPPVKIKSR